MEIGKNLAYYSGIYFSGRLVCLCSDCKRVNHSLMGKYECIALPHDKCEDCGCPAFNGEILSENTEE